MKNSGVLILIVFFLPLCFCADEREEAKQGLEKMGIVFNEPSFFEAVKGGDTEAVRLFLKAGFQPDAKDENGKTPLMHAAERGYIGLARLLMEAGADVNAKDESGKTALMYAAKSAQMELVEILIQPDKDVGSKDKLALIHDGADINVEDRSGTTLKSTTRFDGTEIIPILRKSGEKEEQSDR